MNNFAVGYAIGSSTVSSGGTLAATNSPLFFWMLLAMMVGLPIVVWLLIWIDWKKEAGE